MTEDNQNNEFKPQPLPGQVFIRPGIDDRPDYEKTLTPEAKAAMRRLSVQQHPRIPEASNERPETQAARIASEGGAPLTAAAHLDVAVPNLESSFLDLRDPMTAPDGTKPTAMQANRLVAGFALGSMLLSAPMAAFNTVLIPQTVSRLSGINRVTDLAMLVIAGAIMTFLLNACIAVGSDHSYCRFGRRTPWIVSGSVLAAICMAILSACDFLPWAVFFWLSTQAAYAMAAIPFAAAFGERVPDKFRDRADSWHGKGLALGQLVGVAVAVALTPHAGGEGWDGTTGFAMLVFAGWLVVAAVVTLLVLPFEGASSYLPRRDVENTYRCLSKYSFPNILHPGCFPVVAIYHNMFFLIWINLFHLTFHPSHPQLFLFLLYMILQHSSSLHDVKCRNSRVRCQFLLSARLAHRNS